MGELSGIYKHGLFVLPVAGSLIKKRTLPSTNVASLASLGNDSDSNSNNAVTNTKVRNYEVLTNFDCLVWETWNPAFFLKAFFEDNVFSEYFSHWSHLQLQLLGFLADLDTGVLGWVAGKWEQCSSLWKFWFTWSALCHVEFIGHLPRMASLPSNVNLIFRFSHFLSSFISYLPASLMVKAWGLVTCSNSKFTLSWSMAILSTKWASSLWMSVLLEDWS